MPEVDIKITAKTILFGCSLKSLNATLGYGRDATVVTAVVVQEDDQTFQLNTGVTLFFGIGNLTTIDIGEFRFIGFVQSWERTVIGPSGRDIYEVKLQDARAILNKAKAFSQGESVQQLIDSGLLPPEALTFLGPGHGDAIYVDGIEIPIFPDATTDFDLGFTYNTIQQALEAAVISFGPENFQLDLSEVTEMIEDISGTVSSELSQYRIKGNFWSLSKLLNQLAHDHNFEWFPEIIPGTADDPNKILIRLVNRSQSTELATTMEQLVDMHDGKIISLKEGFESQEGSTRGSSNVLYGGHKQLLLQFGDWTQFWGWKEVTSTSKTEPSTYIPETQSKYELDLMRQAVNGLLDNEYSQNADQMMFLQKLKGYAGRYWGRKFYQKVPDSFRDPHTGEIPGEHLFVETTLGGWYSGVAPGDSSGSVSWPEARNILQMDDGRWVTFVRLPDLVSPQVYHPTVLFSRDAVYEKAEGPIWMRATAEVINGYFLIELATPIVALTSPDVPSSADFFDMVNKIHYAWLPLIDTRQKYGPWGTRPANHQFVGRANYTTDPDIVPWKFGFRGIDPSVAETAMQEYANGKINQAAAPAGLMTIGQLEVADMPRINLGAKFGYGGANITEVSVSWGERGVTTRYTSNVFAKNAGIPTSPGGGFAIDDIEDKQDQQDEEKSTREQPEWPEIEEYIHKNPEPTTIPERPSAGGFLVSKMEGGLGRILQRAGGPYYDVREVDATDFGGLGLENLFLRTWNGVRNVAEPDDSPGYLLVGAFVTVMVFDKNAESAVSQGPFFPYMDQTPPVFAPPDPE